MAMRVPEASSAMRLKRAVDPSATCPSANSGFTPIIGPSAATGSVNCSSTALPPLSRICTVISAESGRVVAGRESTSAVT